ncbi:Capsule polysaccharide biosynthesis [Candidatus Pelagibacterales bacterium]
MISITFVSFAEHEAIFYNSLIKQLVVRNKFIRFDQIIFNDQVFKKYKNSMTNLISPFDIKLNLKNIKLNKKMIKYLIHDKTVYNLKNIENKKKKLKENLIFFKNLISEKKKFKKIFFFQEISGFSGSLSCFFSANKYGCAHYFIEPSFFNERVFFLKNTFDLNIKNKRTKISNKVKKIIDKIKKNKKIISTNHLLKRYNLPIKKILEIKIIFRFFNKILSKYFFQNNEEFNHPIRHAFKFLKMFLNHQFLLFIYDKIPQEKFIYFPLHVPEDFSLTIREPKYLNQLKLIEDVLKKIPKNIFFVTKEHPSMIGALSSIEINRLVNKYKNFKIINPKINNYELIEKSSVVLTINSKTGFEALLLGKKVLTLGKSFYSELKSVLKIKKTDQLSKQLNFIEKKQVKAEEVDNFCQSIWNASNSGILYLNTKKNCLNFARSIEKIITN